MPTLADLNALKVATGENQPIFVMGSDATGDVTHVYAAYKAGKVKGLVIFKWASDPAEMKKKFKDLGMPENVITIVDLAVDRPKEDALNIAIPVGGRNKRQRECIADALIKADLLARNDHRDCVTALCRALKFSAQDLHKSTEFALAGLQDAVKRKELHVDLRGAKGLLPEDSPLVDFCEDKIKIFDKDVVVLWGRTSGKDKTTSGLHPNLGPHLYGDSSTTGLVQIAEKCKAFATVVVTGAVPVENKDRFPGCAYIGAFWDDLKKAPYNLANTQKTQIRTFYVLKQLLKQQNKRLVHVGMRSGNLDNYAFAGQTVVYLVPIGFDDQRIVQLAIKDIDQPVTPKGKSSDTKPGGANRWVQSRPSDSPRVAYRRTLDPLPAELDAVIARTDLRFIDANRKRFEMLNVSLKEKNAADSYPIDVVTQQNANILYRAVKSAVKDDPTLDGSGVLQTYLTQKRGFSDTYLLKLLSQIQGALTKV